MCVQPVGEHYQFKKHHVAKGLNYVEECLKRSTVQSWSQGPDCSDDSKPPIGDDDKKNEHYRKTAPQKECRIIDNLTEAELSSNKESVLSKGGKTIIVFLRKLCFQYKQSQIW